MSTEQPPPPPNEPSVDPVAEFLEKDPRLDSKKGTPAEQRPRLEVDPGQGNPDLAARIIGSKAEIIAEQLREQPNDSSVDALRREKEARERKEQEDKDS